MIEDLGLNTRSECYSIMLSTDRTSASHYNDSKFIGFGATFPKIHEEKTRNSHREDGKGIRPE